MLGQEPFQHPRDDCLVITLMEQFFAELLGRMVPAREGVERRHSCRARIQGLYGLPAQVYASLASPPRFMVAFSGISFARIWDSMSLAISGCCCKKVRALSLP